MVIQHGFRIRWFLISLCAPKIGLYGNSDENIVNLEEGDLSNQITNHSQRILLKFKMKNHKIIILNYRKDTLRIVPIRNILLSFRLIKFRQ